MELPAPWNGPSSTSLERRLPVRIVEATTFHSGVVLLRHERVR